jgi:hypothetical protein
LYRQYITLAINENPVVDTGDKFVIGNDNTGKNKISLWFRPNLKWPQWEAQGREVDSAKKANKSRIRLPLSYKLFD